MPPAELRLIFIRARVVQLGSFGWMKDIFFPIWLGFMVLCFVCLESRKQYRRYFAKGAANVCGFMEVINEDHALTNDKAQDRLVPRTEDLPIYTMAEFNDKVDGGGNLSNPRRQQSIAIFVFFFSFHPSLRATPSRGWMDGFPLFTIY